MFDIDDLGLSEARANEETGRSRLGEREDA
jgi:hypothetical protein